jgi:hypothetical protein
MHICDGEAALAYRVQQLGYAPSNQGSVPAGNEVQISYGAPHKVLPNLYRVLSSGVKRLGREANYSSLSSVEVTNVWSITSIDACKLIMFRHKLKVLVLNSKRIRHKDHCLVGYCPVYSGKVYRRYRRA